MYSLYNLHVFRDEPSPEPNHEEILITQLYYLPLKNRESVLEAYKQCVKNTNSECLSISHLLKVNHLLFHPWWTSAKKMLYWKMMMIIIWSLLWQEVLWLFLCVGILPSASPQCRTFFCVYFFLLWPFF